MALHAIEKKTTKMKKMLKYVITVNTNNMTTKIAKGLKTDSDSKTEVKAR